MFFRLGVIFMYFRIGGDIYVFYTRGVFMFF